MPRDLVLVRIGWMLTAMSMALYLTIPLSLSGGVMSRPGIVSATETSDVVAGMVIFLFLGSGILLIRARPRNPIGWLVLASGALQSVQMSAEGYGARALTDPDRSLPLGLPVMWLASWAWMPSLALVVAVLPGLYPTGRPTSTFWRWQIRGALVGIGLLVVLAATTQGGVDDVVADVRLPWDAPTWYVVALGVPAAVLVVGSIIVALVGTLVRAVRARAPERQQLLLLLVFQIGMVIGFLSPYEFSFALVYGLLPVAVVVGVLRYRLLGIEVALRRTMLYVPLTVLVALVVGGITTSVARLVPVGPLPLLMGSAVVAVLVIPVAGWLRGRVDRFVLGERVDPLTAVHRLGVGLEGAGDDPVQSMLRAVSLATGATHARAVDASGREIATVGSPDGSGLEVPLRHSGHVLGSVTVGPRQNLPRVGESDAQLLAVLAPHLAVVVRSRALTEQLAVERARVAEATLAERDRLRRDLHDGLGPSMSGIALGLEAAALALASDPTTVREILAHTRAEATAATTEIRRVLDGLRPSVLDRAGLAGAVQETASSLGLGVHGGVALQLDVDPTPLAPCVEETVFRIVAEALTNISRHAEARRCLVSVRSINGQVQIRICDDGVGLLQDHTPGHGLESMRSRAADLGGQIAITPANPRGTEVSAVIPLGPS